MTLPMTLWCDNQGVIHIVSNPLFPERMKHIKVDFHVGREKIQQGLNSKSHVRITKLLADIFTKALVGIGLIIIQCQLFPKA